MVAIIGAASRHGPHHTASVARVITEAMSELGSGVWPSPAPIPLWRTNRDSPSPCFDSCSPTHTRIIVVDPDIGALHEVDGKLELGPPKTAKSARTITLPPFLIDLLRAHLDTR